MTLGQSVQSCYSNYATFSGRAARSEYWFFVLYQCLVGFVCGLLMAFGIGQLLLWLFVVANLLPAISVTVRRLHDTDHSGWWYWIALVPLVGAILLIVWFCTRGTSGANRFGSDPLSGVH
ncbi:MAG: DUF805 domain-containing protein [Pseudomonadota bacterium]